MMRKRCTEKVYLNHSNKQTSYAGPNFFLQYGAARSFGFSGVAFEVRAIVIISVPTQHL